jgi:hypothetical protein
MGCTSCYFMRRMINDFVRRLYFARSHATVYKKSDIVPHNRYYLKYLFILYALKRVLNSRYFITESIIVSRTKPSS